MSNSGLFCFVPPRKHTRRRLSRAQGGVVVVVVRGGEGRDLASLGRLRTRCCSTSPISMVLTDARSASRKKSLRHI